MEVGEDDDAGAGLEEAQDFDGHLLANEGLGLVDDNHGAVVEVADALALVLALAHDAEGKDFAGQDDRLEDAGQLVEVEMGDGLEFGDFAEVVEAARRKSIEVNAQKAGIIEASQEPEQQRVTIGQAIDEYLDFIKAHRKERTYVTYR